MAFDSATRNRLARFVNEARNLVAAEFAEKFQSLYGLSPAGEITPAEKLTHLDDSQRAVAHLLRERVAHLIASNPAEKNAAAAAIERLTREQAFTILNRLAAVRMAEKRGLIEESVGKGYESKGFRVYSQVAGTALGDTYQRYRRYLFCLFDDLAVDLGVLFDRRSPSGLLFPRETCLLKLLELLNASEIESLWAEDETVGWIYQYYNDPAERKKMRDASASPRNSRELAVRNQFFTPRYVVEFLTDNTLGRIWYDMTKGETKLKDICRYLVRRPTEAFLKEGVMSTGIGSKQEGNSQEELLKQPVEIAYRPLKDPRTILMLDPACGSMHFGLCAFDLFEAIYEESWDLEVKLGAEALSRLPGMKSLREEYSSREMFLRDVPRLVIEHNIHGIDIDPRAAQIAGLSLWLRAQRTWQQQGVKAAERPRIRRSSIVCAEPMPGEESFLKEFLEKHLSGTPELKLLGQLVCRVFESMKFAGEAGSLLKIEEVIAGAVTDAKRQWLDRPKAQQIALFVEPSKAEQTTLGLDVLGITDETFWERAEDRIYAALRDYSEQAESGGFQRRLFAEDAARGFAFIDVCRKRYDAVLMNPPFGDPPESVNKYLKEKFADINNNLLCAFLERGYNLLDSRGRLGAIYDRTAIVKNTYENFRRSYFVSDYRLVAQADLGWEVLDANVETTTSVISRGNQQTSAVFFDVRREQAAGKGDALLNAVNHYDCGTNGELFTVLDPTGFSRFPNAVLGHDFPAFIVRLFARLPNLGDSGVQVIQGHTLLSERFFRYWWEVPLERAFTPGAPWQRFYNGGDYCRFNSPLRDAVLYGLGGELVANHESTIFRNAGLQQKGKIGFGKRGDFIDAHVLPAGFVSSVEGQAVILHGDADPFATLALLNSELFQAVLNLYCGQHKYPGYVHLFPCADWTSPGLVGASTIARDIFAAKDRAESIDETNPKFLHSTSLQLWNENFLSDLSELKRFVLRKEGELNAAVFDAYSLTPDAKTFVATAVQRQPTTGGILDEDSRRFWAEACVSYCVGAAFGRWDLRQAIGTEQATELLDPFSTLPVSPPGLLQNSKGTPATLADLPSSYPLRIPWSGILVEEQNHPDDIVAKVRSVMKQIWGNGCELVERLICECLAEEDICSYIRKPSGFFADHLKRYSIGRRQAPIYWPLSSASGSYTVWVYYQRLSEQTLHSVLADYLDPKLKSLTREISRSREAVDATDLGVQTELADEVREFRKEVASLISLPWKPNLNDGVLVTASPMWKMFRLGSWQKELKTCWQRVCAGDFDWSHLAFTIWPERINEKCKMDQSLAITHGVESLYAGPIPKAKVKRRTKSTQSD